MAPPPGMEKWQWSISAAPHRSQLTGSNCKRRLLCLQYNTPYRISIFRVSKSWLLPERLSATSPKLSIHRKFSSTTIFCRENGSSNSKWYRQAKRRRQKGTDTISGKRGSAIQYTADGSPSRRCLLEEMHHWKDFFWPSGPGRGELRTELCRTMDGHKLRRPQAPGNSSRAMI